MNIATIITPNAKGQVVIPSLMRKALDIASDTQMTVTLREGSIMLTPVAAVISKIEHENSYLSLLQSTQGAWKDDASSPKAKRKTELSASSRRKRAW